MKINCKGLSNLKAITYALAFHCPALVEVDLSQLTSLETVRLLFRQCGALMKIDCKGLSNLKNITGPLAFRCPALVEVDLSQLTSFVIVGSLFRGCNALMKINCKGLTAFRGPGAPKRSLTPFLYFSGEQRATVVTAHSTFKVTDVAKFLGEEWKKLDSETKDRYVHECRVDAKRYDLEWAAYMEGEEYQALVRRLHQEQLMKVADDAVPSSSAAGKQKGATQGTKPVGGKKAPQAEKGFAAAASRQAAHSPFEGEDGHQFLEASLAVEAAFNSEWKKNKKGDWVCLWDSDADADDSMGQSGGKGTTTNGKAAASVASRKRKRFKSADEAEGEASTTTCGVAKDAKKRKANLSPAKK